MALILLRDCLFSFSFFFLSIVQLPDAFCCVAAIKHLNISYMYIKAMHFFKDQLINLINLMLKIQMDTRPCILLVFLDILSLIDFLSAL